MTVAQTKIVGRGVYFRGERVAVLLEGETSFSAMEDFRIALLEIGDPELDDLRHDLEFTKGELHAIEGTVEALQQERDDIREQLAIVSREAAKAGDLAEQVQELVSRVQRYERDH